MLRPFHKEFQLAGLWFDPLPEYGQPGGSRSTCRHSRLR